MANITKRNFKKEFINFLQKEKVFIKFQEAIYENKRLSIDEFIDYYLTRRNRLNREYLAKAIDSFPWREDDNIWVPIYHKWYNVVIPSK